MLHNGIYFPDEYENNNTGFDPQNLLIFKMSPLTREIIRCYPQVESLAPLYPAAKVRETTAKLIKNNILKTGSATLPTAPPLPTNYSDFAILLETPGDKDNKDNKNNEDNKDKRMSRETLCRLIDFFLTETSATPSPGITFIMDGDVESRLPLIHEAIQGLRRHGGQKIRILLKIPASTLSINLLTLAKKYRLFLYLTFFPGVGVSLLQHAHWVFGTWQNSLHKRQRKQLADLRKIAGIRLDPPEAGDIPEILNLFETNGIPRIHLDWQCRYCQMPCRSGTIPGHIVPDVVLIDSLLRFRYLKDKAKGPHVAGFINHFPILLSLVASQRNFYGCAAGISYCAGTPAGDFYPCHNVTGDPTKIIGNIREGFFSQSREKLNRQRVEHRPACLHCWGRYVCGGYSKAGGNENICRAFLALLQKLLLLYDSLDMMDKNIILDNSRQFDNYLPQLKKSTAPLTTTFENPQVLTVRSDSMRPLLKAGDQIVVAPLHGSNVRVGDIICYGRPITCHRVIARFRQEGEDYIIEKGDGIRAGKKIAEREISGRVIAIRTKKRQYTITSAKWQRINFFIAQVSRCMHFATVTFFSLKNKGRKLWTKK